MTDQLSLFADDDEPLVAQQPMRFPSAHPIVILRWDEASEMVCSEWPEFNLRATFQDWALALEMVLHEPTNDHVSVRVRT